MWLHLVNRHHRLLPWCACVPDSSRNTFFLWAPANSRFTPTNQRYFQRSFVKLLRLFATTIFSHFFLFAFSLSSYSRCCRLRVHEHGTFSDQTWTLKQFGVMEIVGWSKVSLLLFRFFIIIFITFYSDFGSYPGVSVHSNRELVDSEFNTSWSELVTRLYKAARERQNWIIGN